jgi:hypothetical protein
MGIMVHVKSPRKHKQHPIVLNIANIGKVVFNENLEN